MIWNILCYHSVDPGQANAFTRQLQWFRDWEGYEFRSFQEAFAERKRVGSRKWMTVSFDDGDWTVATVVQKVLDAEGIRAMLYLSTDYIVQGTRYRDRDARPTLGWEEIGRWLEAGHEIGSHSHTHVNAKECEFGQWVDDLAESRRVIEQRLGTTPRHFAYPWGQHNEQTDRWFREQNEWRSAALVQSRFNQSWTDPFLLRRNPIAATWDAPTLDRIVRGRIARFFHRWTATNRVD